MTFWDSVTVQNRFFGEILSEKTYQYVYNRPYGDFRFFHLKKPLLEAHLDKIHVFAENMKYRSKNRIFHIYKLKFGVFNGFSTYLSDITHRKSLSPKIKKLYAFFWPKWLIFGKITHVWAFLRKTQNGSKKCVFGLQELKFSSFDVFSEYISYAS